MTSKNSVSKSRELSPGYAGYTEVTMRCMIPTTAEVSREQFENLCLRNPSFPTAYLESIGSRFIPREDIDKQEDVQKLCDVFNECYASACVTGEPKDWGDATLAARRIVNELVARGVVEDTFPEVHTRLSKGIGCAS